MYKVTKETLKKAYKPYDVVTNENGDVGIIQEVSVNSCQESFDWQISYAVNWIIGNESKHAWFHHKELIRHSNIFEEIAKMSCHASGNSENSIEDLFNNWEK